MPILSEEDIHSMGFRSVGKHVQISSKASFYGINRISIGDHVRIDDFCVLSAGIGGIQIGNYVHISIGASLIGAGKITLCDYTAVSSRASIYSSNDDYSGAAMTNPTLPSKYTNVQSADVYLHKHVIIGSGSVILPGVTLEEGVAVGALSLINKNCAAFGIYSGNPAKRIKDRKRDLLEMEKAFVSSQDAC
jgi:dTDP-4-amino-4,6-dideoxy-D-glucose acyltransferase